MITIEGFHYGQSRGHHKEYGRTHLDWGRPVKIHPDPFVELAFTLRLQYDTRCEEDEQLVKDLTAAVQAIEAVAQRR